MEETIIEDSKEQAEKENRSVSNYIETILKEAKEKREMCEAG